jgi:hypothetical protein
MKVEWKAEHPRRTLAYDTGGAMENVVRRGR